MKNILFFDMRKSKASPFNAAVEYSFLNKTTEGFYPVFLINEPQGRGTDFKTSDDIEESGGNYLLIVDIFSQRSLEQIIGRVGRLDKKGQWSYLLYSPNEIKTLD